MKRPSLYVIQTIENSCLLLRLSGERYTSRVFVYVLTLFWENVWKYEEIKYIWNKRETEEANIEKVDRVFWNEIWITSKTNSKLMNNEQVNVEQQNAPFAP